jgi:hypothetical protein
MTATLRPAFFTPEGSPNNTLHSLPSSTPASSPSSLTFSDSPFPNNTPPTSPAPQQLPAPPQTARPVMSESKGSLQWEGGADDNLSPGQFLREIDNKIDERGYTTEKQKINCMRNNIAYGSDADEWFGALTGAQKDTYEHLMEAFELQWPLNAVPKASKAERIQALKDWTLRTEDIGKKVEGPGGSQVWSHVKWATGLASRVRDAGDTSAFLITDVYNGLPRPVRELIRKEPRTTYTGEGGTYRHPARHHPPVVVMGIVVVVVVVAIVVAFVAVGDGGGGGGGDSGGVLRSALITMCSFVSHMCHVMFA